MQIKSIKIIKEYKSFVDFEWQKFCNKKNKEGEKELSFFGDFTAIFGENGCGKSSICDVLKSVSKKKYFQKTSPALAEIEINDGNGNKVHKYENGNWTSQISENSILFFDADFINANVHTHGLRSNNLQQGAHTQKAGKLIISLDERANNLEVVIEEKRYKIEEFGKSSFATILKNIFSAKDKEFFETYKDKDNETKQGKLSETQNKLNELKAGLVMLKKLRKEHSKISRLSEVDQVIFPNLLPSKERFTELFIRQIKEKAQDQVDEKIKNHFTRHKKFIEYAKSQIPEKYTNENCPLCMQPLVNATNVIEYYRTVFDQTYEDTKEQFLSDIRETKNELEMAKTNLNSLHLKISIVFDTLEKIKTDFEIQDIYKLEEKTEQIRKFADFPTKEIDDLLTALESLRQIDREQVDATKLYDAFAKIIQEVKESVESANSLIAEKNRLINDFKSQYSAQSKITSEIEEKQKEEIELSELADFLESDKIKKIKEQNEAVTKQENLSRELRNAKRDLESYLAKTIPESVILNMKTILDKFNLSFVLEHTAVNANTKNYSFSFKIKDQEDNERELKDGLSEGERQLISLAFFFAVRNKDKAVLILDDPITSLDSPNIKILAELIHQKANEFSQVIVFTHHPLFFKYLAKCKNPDTTKFGILKNTVKFGGSFMFFDPGFDLFEEVKKSSQEITQNAQNGNLKLEEIALKYGQLLRLAVETFIKNDLLMWNKENKFDEITKNLRQGKSKIAKLSDDDFEVITNVYKYCNYSNLLHADKETASSLSELKQYINKFSRIFEKVRGRSY